MNLSMKLAGAALAICLSQPAFSSEGVAAHDEMIDAFNRIDVPEVRGDPDSRLIQPAYLHLTGNPEGVPTFVFFGGPGQSALEYGSLEALRNAHTALLETGDVVFIEQRGIGASLPSLDCGTLHFPFDEELSRARLVEAHGARLEECIAASGADMRGYTADAIADDAEAIRLALGYERINLSGGSFGATQAYAYIQRHSDHVHRAAISQFLVPGTSLALPSTVDGYLGQIGDRVGPLLEMEQGGGEMLLGLMTGIFEQVENQPVSIDLGETTLVVGRTDMEIITALALRRSRESWMMPMLFHQMSQGDFSFIGQVMMQFYRGGFPVNAAGIALDCADQTNATRRAAFDAEAETSLMGYGSNLPFPDTCDNMAHGANETRGLEPGSLNGVPTLIIQGELDARARDENLTAWLDGQSNARLLVIKNATHDLGRSVSPEMDGQLSQIEAAFLADGTWPEEAEIEVPLSLE